MAVDLEKLSVQLADEGKLIEAGFVGLRMAAMAPDAPEDQVREMRWAFMAGAQHLFASIMTILEPGDEEPTERDMARMDLIHQELKNFYQELQTRYTPTKGSA